MYRPFKINTKRIFSIKYHLFSISIIIIFFLITANQAFSDSGENFNTYLKEWDQKIKIASEYLEDAEKELKNGDAIEGCIKQRKAAEYGIQATQSLIMAFKENGSDGDINNVKAGLDKWKELRDFC
ncbi:MULTISPECIES: hypothetical protein [unclassified Prochlorococcus]|uniref:hypothetical protein n=1 Tax=unclassified Prochlorococcus TaxID=2627481 RepID=UPI0005339BB0|nr:MULTISPECIES: hypothetical protein [unclassified Prochlorococcus]KGG15052.1 hypothetical protein EV06_0915 [Prochlorococcus sp. MIT 0602]KGG17323.1 hypothetical protein EV07_0761 [Prochlorococcus sp. MIT 0603]